MLRESITDFDCYSTNLREHWIPCALLVSALLSVSGPALAQDIPDQDEGDDDPLGRADWFYAQRAYPGTRVPGGARLQALAELRRLNPAIAGRTAPRATGSGQWTSIGPTPIGAGPNPSAGRVTAIAVDPRDKDTVYAGVSEGGVWKSTNGGQSWAPLTDGELSMAVGAIAIDPANPDTIYAGTGESNNSGDSYYGAGILKSTNGGANWTQLAGPFVGVAGGAHIGALAVFPAQTDILLAGVSFGGSSGIWRSVDGAVSWSRVSAEPLAPTSCSIRRTPALRMRRWEARRLPLNPVSINQPMRELHGAA